MASNPPAIPSSYPLISGLILLLALAICLAVLLLWIVRHAKAAARKSVVSDQPHPNQATGTAAHHPEEPAKTVALDTSFQHNVNRLRQLAAGRNYRYDVPWVLMVGPSGSGKTTALHSVGLRRIASTNAPSGLPQSLRVGWHFFEEGLTLDVPGTVFLGSGAPLSQDRWWRQLLRQLRTARSQRPLDAVVLVLSVEELRAPAAGPSQLALLLRDRLLELQKQIEMRVPIYLLISKCDLLTGFAAFSRELPEPLRSQMFGWSNPHSIDLAFSSGWMEEAVFSIGDRIDRLVFEMFATDAARTDASGIFLLRKELSTLQSGLHEFASRIFSETPYGQSPLLRGIYLTGDPEGAPVPDSAPPSRTAPPHPVFLDDLLARKVYAEKGVATPFPRAFLSKNRLTLTLQIATAVFALAATIGTGVAYSRLNEAKHKQLIPLLAKLRDQGGPTASFSGENAFRVIRAMTALQMDPFHSLFFPASWSDSIDRSLGDTMVQSFLTVFEGLRTALDSRHDQILAKISTSPSQCSNPGSRETHIEHLPQYQQLNTFVSDLQAWNSNVDLFDRIVSPGYVNPDDLKKLVLYLNPTLVSQDVDFRSNPYFQQALNRVSDQTYRRFDSLKTTHTVEKLSSCFFHAWFDNNVLLTYTDEIEKQVHSLQTGSLTFDELGTLSQAIGTVSALVEQPDFQWAAKDHFDATDYAVFQNPVLQSRVVDPADLANDLTSAGDEAFQTFRTTLPQTPSPSIESIVEQTPNQLVISDALVTLSAFVGKMEQQPFLAHIPEGRAPEKPLGRLIMWNVDLLNAAAQLYRTFSAYSFGTLPMMFVRPVQDVAAARTQANMLDLIASAQSFESATTAAPGTASDLRAVNNLTNVAPLLAELLQDFSQSRLTAGRRILASVLNDQATQLLASLDASERQLNPYEVKDSTFRWWNGQTPLSPLAYQVSTEEAVKTAVASQTAVLRELAQAAGPALNLLHISNSLSALPSHASQVNWAGVLEDFKKLDGKKPNPISSLETFLTSGLDKVSPDTSCADPSLVALADPSDLFVSIEKKIRRDLQTRCRELAGNGYAQIATRFNEHLAGRFPFADATSDAEAVEADPSDIVKFWGVFDRYQASATEALQSATTNTGGTKQRAFLQQLAAVRPLFAPLLSGAAKDTVPSYDVQVQFRTNRSAEVQGDQIIDWEFDVAAQSVVPSSKVNTASWHVGDPTRVSLRFAKNSPLRPIPDRRSPGQVIGMRTVSFEYSDTWSLFRLIRLHQNQVLALSTGALPAPCTLSFYILTTPDLAVLPSSEATMGGQVRVYLQLAVTSAGTKGVLQFPPFPTAAPSPADVALTSASTR